MNKLQPKPKQYCAHCEDEIISWKLTEGDKVFCSPPCRKEASGDSTKEEEGLRQCDDWLQDHEFNN